MQKYSLGQTENPKLFRVLDRSGDWTHYFDEESGRTLRAANFILNRGFAKGPQFLDALKNSSAESWDKKTSDACDRGDAVHQAVLSSIHSGTFNVNMEVLAEDNKTYRPLTPSEAEAAMSFARLWNDHGMIAVHAEKAVKNLEVGYAGTLDLLAVMTKICGEKSCKCKYFIGLLGLWDHKSGKGIYESYGPQVGAYAKADLKHLIKNRKIEYTAIDHLGRGTERGYKIEFYDSVETERHWKEFLAAEVIMRATYKPFNWLTDNEETPDEMVLEKFEEAKPKEFMQVAAYSKNDAIAKKIKPAKKMVVRRKTIKK